MACQWAASEGIRLIGTAGTDDKCQLALDHGAKPASTTRQDWVAEVQDLTGGKGVTWSWTPSARTPSRVRSIR
jgi:NADPH2:quinone reductase